MLFSITTHWNTDRHQSGEAIIEEILKLGLNRVELGYDLTLDLVPGVKKMVAAGAVTVDTVHNFCPVPTASPIGHPELYSLASTDSRERALAVKYTTATIRFAAEIGAKVVVFHCGRVNVAPDTHDLILFMNAGHLFDTEFEKRRQRLIEARERRFQPHLDATCSGLEELLPVLQETGVKLGLEILPYWEGIPSELEAEKICARFETPSLGYWHDIGHGQIRENLGFGSHIRWLERLRPRLLGMHIHDVIHPATDHVMPPKGGFKFALFRHIARDDIFRVFEPMPGLPTEEVAEGIRLVRACWEAPQSGAPRP